MREKLETLPLAQLKELAKAQGLKGTSTMKKAELIDLLVATAQEAGQSGEGGRGEKPERKEKPGRGGRKSRKDTEEHKDEDSGHKGEEGHGESGDGVSLGEDKELLDSGIVANGILEVMADGYGFIRCENYLPGENDVYVAPSQIRRFNLKTGDIIVGNTRVKTGNEKFSALLYVKSINGMHPSEAAKRYNFEDMTPVFPNERIHLEAGNNNIAMRIMDLISPVGKGQRGMIVSPPKAGKTTLLKAVAKAVTRANPEIHLIILLIDERPEEVTDIKESIQGDNVEVIYSTFDELP